MRPLGSVLASLAPAPGVCSMFHLAAWRLRHAVVLLSGSNVEVVVEGG